MFPTAFWKISALTLNLLEDVMLVQDVPRLSPPGEGPAWQQLRGGTYFSKSNHKNMSSGLIFFQEHLEKYDVKYEL